MPYAGLGLHLIIALFFAVHALRNGREMYWLIILFSFPLLGSIVYFLVVYLPNSRMDRGLRNVVAAAAKTLDPGRELREAQLAFDLTPTAQNQMRLANALLMAGAVPEAVRNFDLCLHGPFANDPKIRLGAARAKLQNKQASEARQLLSDIRKQRPDFSPEQVALLLAQSLAAEGKEEEARQEFTDAVARYGSVESLAEFLIWAASIQDLGTVRRLQGEIEQAQRYWNKHVRSLHQPLLRRVNNAIEACRSNI